MFAGIRKFFSDIPYKLRGQKKFISCDWLEHGIIFDHANIIRVCCEQSHDGKGRFVLDDSFNGIWLDIEKINNLKKEHRTMVRNGVIPDSCKGCAFLREDYWNDDNYFSNILLTHWSNCNTRCIYCPAIRDNNLSDENHYNIIPIIEQLIDAKLIPESAHFSIAGGESTIYPEFDKLVYFLMEYGISDININSSGIKFCPSIAEGISKNLAEVVISLDSGSAFIYKKIKGTDTFNVVINNIKRYLEYQQIGEERVIVKFILLKGINDNNKEILDWFMLCKNLGVTRLALDLDIGWYKDIQYSVPEYVKDLIIFATDMAKINSVSLDLYDRANIIYKSCKN